MVQAWGKGKNNEGKNYFSLPPPPPLAKKENEPARMLGWCTCMRSNGDSGCVVGLRECCKIESPGRVVGMASEFQEGSIIFAGVRNPLNDLIAHKESVEQVE